MFSRYLRSNRSILPRINDYRSLSTGVAVPLSHVEQKTVNFMTSWQKSSTQDKFSIHVPLPGRMGLTKITMDNHDTLGSFRNKLQSLDPSVTSFIASDDDHIPYSATTKIQLLSKVESFHININGNELVVFSSEHGKVTGDDDTLLDNVDGFTSMKKLIQSETRKIISVEELNRLLVSHGCHDEKTKQVWMRRLHELDLILHFSQSNIEDLKNSIIIQPESSHSLMVDALDIEGSAVYEEIKKVSSKIDTLKAEHIVLTSIKLDVESSAHRKGMVMACAGLAGLGTQFGVLAYAVWGVYSWDVMEPFCYFLGMGSVLGSYGYFLVNKKNANYSTMLSNYKEKKTIKLYAQKGVAAGRIHVIVSELGTLESRLKVLEKRILR